MTDLLKRFKVDVDKININTFEGFAHDIKVILRAMDMHYTEQGNDRDNEILHLLSDIESVQPEKLQGGE